MPNRELPAQTIREISDIFHASVNTIISLGKEHPELQPPLGLTSTVGTDGKSVILSKPGSFSMQLKSTDPTIARVNIRRVPTSEEAENGIRIPKEMTIRSSDATKDSDVSQRYPTLVITKTIGGNIYSKKNPSRHFMYNPTKNEPIPENQPEKFPEEYAILANMLAIYATIYLAKSQKKEQALL